MFSCPDHPDVTAALVTGYPAGAAPENQDTAELRREFAQEYSRDFIDYAVAGDPEILENFVEEHSWLYKSWLN